MVRAARSYHAEAGRGSGAELVLDADESHHLSRVLRVQPGETISVFDGRGPEWRAVVVAAPGGAIRLRLEAELADPVEPDLPVRLYQGQGWVGAQLGPRTLRTETAGIVAGAIVLHLWSDLGAGRSV
jgi:16S rRNA U1498 N3-methylase RsmE